MTPTVLVLFGLYGLPHDVRHVQRPFRWVARVLLRRFEGLLPLRKRHFEVLKHCPTRYALLPLQLLRVRIFAASCGPKVMATVVPVDVIVDT